MSKTYSKVLDRLLDGEALGETGAYELMQRLAAEHPERIAVRVGFSNELAHRIEAGADMFLMPSRYEPCGLNQLFGLKYGSVPVVRETGGLSDTVCDATSENVAAGTATGFRFQAYEPEALELAVHRAVEMFHQQPDTWRQIVETGMRQDWSWDNSARQYASLYEAVVARRIKSRQMQQTH